MAQTSPTPPAAPAGATEFIKSVLDAKAQRKNDNFVEANLLFLAYHELGHALFAEFDVPIAGREEDAADRLAAYMMTPDKGEEVTDPYLTDAIVAWFALGAETSLDKIAWWAAHGTGDQRAYQAACLLYGSDPRRFKDVADMAGIPQTRRQDCPAEAARNERAWDRLLDPHVRSDRPDDHAPLDSVTMTYAPSQDYAAERAFMMKAKVLEELRRLVTDIYQFKPGITLSAEQCGEPNAFWRARDRRLTICYELAREYRKIAELPDEE